jgi:hypothetical protein
VEVTESSLHLLQTVWVMVSVLVVMPVSQESMNVVVMVFSVEVPGYEG